MKSTLVASSLAAALCATTAVRAQEVAPAPAPEAAPAPAAEMEVSEAKVHVWAGLDFKTAYTATGATCNDGWVAQPCVDIFGLTFGDFVLPVTFEFWGNIDLERYDEDPDSKGGHFQEIDLAAYLNLGDYIYDGLTFDVGYLEYDYPSHDADPDHLVHFVAKYGFDFDNWGEITPKLQAKYRVAGPSEGKCEYAAEISWGVTLAKDVCCGKDLGFSVSADAWYVDNRGMDRDEDGARPESGWCCSYLTAKVSLGDFYVGVQRIFRFEDDVLPDGAYGYDEKWIGMCGVSYEF